MFCCQSVARVNVITIELQCSTCGTLEMRMFNVGTSEMRMGMGGENVFERKSARFQGFGEWFPLKDELF